MLTLCLDTAHKYLSVCLIENNQILAFYNELCPKKQSENVFKAISEVFLEAGKTPHDLKSIVVSEGPGSYTGVRIAMTIAKTLGSLGKLEVKTISTLKLYANNKENTLVILDARSKRAYYGAYNNGTELIKDNVDLIENIRFDSFDVVGDLSLLGKEDKYYNIAHCFLNTINDAKIVEDVDYMVPVYLKSNEEYL